MLVLSRKVGEEIFIGDNIVLEVIEMRRGVVRLGISAPRDVVILRAEVARRLEEEKQKGEGDELR